MCNKVTILFLKPMQDSSGASGSLSRAEFIDLACTAAGGGSGEEYGLLFDSVVVTQTPCGLPVGCDKPKEDGRVNWMGMCSFLLVTLSEKINKSRGLPALHWKPPHTLTSPQQDTLQKVKNALILSGTN